MTFKLACGDVMPGCSARFEAADRPGLLRIVGAHAEAEHGITTLTPQVTESIESRMTVSA